MLLKLKLAAGAVCLVLCAQARAEQPPLAELMSVEPVETGINVTVPTGGCTKKADFEASASQASKGAAKIEIRRLRRDSCKGYFPDGLKFSFTWDDLKLPPGTKLTVANLAPSRSAPLQATAKVSRKKCMKSCKRSKAKARHWRTRRAGYKGAPKKALHGHRHHGRCRS
jgi:hypothetical protein